MQSMAVATLRPALQVHAWVVDARSLLIHWDLKSLFALQFLGPLRKIVFGHSPIVVALWIYLMV